MSVVTRERRFHNEKSTQFRLLRRAISRSIGEFRRDREILDYVDLNDKRVLDYGCGAGENEGMRLLTEDLRALGASEVVGIDISDVEIERARARVASKGLSNVRFVVGDAHDTGLADESFDIIIGGGILHHLDLERALREIARVLSPGGRAVFVEPLCHNPILRLGRRLTPQARTPDEHPIKESDWALCSSLFPHFRHSERELVSIFFMPLNFLLPTPLQKRLAAVVGKIDDRVIGRAPRLGKYSRITFLVLEK